MSEYNSDNDWLSRTGACSTPTSEAILWDRPFGWQLSVHFYIMNFLGYFEFSGRTRLTLVEFQFLVVFALRNSPSNWMILSRFLSRFTANCHWFEYWSVLGVSYENRGHSSSSCEQLARWLCFLHVDLRILSLSGLFINSQFVPGFQRFLQWPIGDLVELDYEDQDKSECCDIKCCWRRPWGIDEDVGPKQIVGCRFVRSNALFAHSVSPNSLAHNGSSSRFRYLNRLAAQYVKFR